MVEGFEGAEVIWSGVTCWLRPDDFRSCIDGLHALLLGDGGFGGASLAGESCGDSSELISIA